VARIVVLTIGCRLGMIASSQHIFLDCSLYFSSPAPVSFNSFGEFLELIDKYYNAEFRCTKVDGMLAFKGLPTIVSVINHSFL
jgi:hypothetical protein